MATDYISIPMKKILPKHKELGRYTKQIYRKINK